MKDLDFFKNEAVNRGLCSDYSNMWVNAQSKQELFNFAMKANSIRYIAKSMYEGWGMSVEYLAEEFKDFINGKEVGLNEVDGKSLTGYMFVNSSECYEDLKATVFNVISCNGIKLVCNNYATQYHINNNSDAEIVLPKECIVSIYLYDDSTVTFNKEYATQKVTIYDYREKSNDMFPKGTVVRNRDLYIDAFGRVQHKNK